MRYDYLNINFIIFCKLVFKYAIIEESCVVIPAPFDVSIAYPQTNNIWIKRNFFIGKNYTGLCIMQILI